MVPRLRSEGLQPSAGDLRRRCTAICFDYWFPGIFTSQKPIVLSLAHLTSWSAERIARATTTTQKCPEKNNDILAEEVWDFYMAWVEHLPRCRSRLEDMEKSMWENLQQFRFDILVPCAKERNLANTPRPTTFTYARLWLPTERYSGPEIPSFLPEDGIDNYRACMRLAENGPMTCFTPAELKIIEQLGPHVRPMIRTVMNECMEYLERDMMTGEFSRKVFDLHRHLGKIMQLGNRVVELWCHTFGSVEVFADSWNVRVRRDEETGYDEQVDEVVTQLKDQVEISKRRQIKKSIAKTQGRCLVYLNSSPQAIKMLVICMVTDRIHALDELRHNRRQETGGTLFDLYLVVDSMRVKDASKNGIDRLKLEVVRFVGFSPSPAPSPTIMFLVRAEEQPQFIPIIPERGSEISEEQLQALQGGRDVSVTVGDGVMMVRQETPFERALRQLD
ncbi:hypothetical protein GMDG_01811 [Pseudogymnoascus destructans 20631-21]|uniref:Uncharacterized protein n=1 Tax=Pseudogymnoascus destructans (strain ATCC MYA-4855 / 20631-21) TaxID=658429 RepID=L8G124_PSED2|nr:hypothetical protein GMDG_01811 [Pseudogymnoascus destructans 20631-21]